MPLQPTANKVQNITHFLCDYDILDQFKLLLKIINSRIVLPTHDQVIE